MYVSVYMNLDICVITCGQISFCLMAGVEQADNKLFNVGRKEGNVLFYDAFRTFYLQLYGVGIHRKGPIK